MGVSLELSDEEIRTLRCMVERATGHGIRRPHLDSVTWSNDPLSAELMNHRPKLAGSGWGCICGRFGYVSEHHVLLTHVKPIVEKAATQKVREILDRAGMDLDVIMQSDKIFGGNP